VVAFGRRAMRIMTSHYVDDFPTVDMKAGKGLAQKGLHLILDLSGTGWSADKCQAMSTSNKFLGQINDLKNFREGTVEYRATPGRAETITGHCDEALSTLKLPQGQASKLRGLIQFYGTTTQGNVSKGGAVPLAQRASGADPGTHVHTQLSNSLEYTKTMVAVSKPRHIVLRRQRPQLRAWSDAEYDPEQPELGGGVGLVLQRCDTGEVHAIAMRASSYFISQFLPRKQQIGQLEAIAVLFACLVLAPFLQGTDILWGIDNTSAEASLVRGYSPKQDTADIVAATALLLNALDTRPWFFHVDSDSNPSDGLSRDGIKDAWTQAMTKQHSWQTRECEVPNIGHLSTLPFRLMTEGLLGFMDYNNGE
jgi:hypothetical protein